MKRLLIIKYANLILILIPSELFEFATVYVDRRRDDQQTIFFTEIKQTSCY